MVIILKFSLTTNFCNHVIHANINGVSVTVPNICMIRSTAQVVKVFVYLTFNPLDSQLPEHGDRAGVSQIEVSEMFITQRTIKGVDRNLTVKLCCVRLCDLLLTHALNCFKHLFCKSFQNCFRFITEICIEIKVRIEHLVMCVC